LQASIALFATGTLAALALALTSGRETYRRTLWAGVTANIIRNVWACPEHLMDVPDALAAHPTDVLVVDFLMQGALAQARRTSIPVAVLAHSSVAGIVPPPDSPMGSARLAAANEFRSSIGLPRMERLNDGWDGLPTIVTTIPELDPAADSAAETVRYVGPIAERSPQSTWDPPWAANDGRALVLTPRFSPSAQEITYLSYAQGTPRVYLRNIDSGQQEALGDFPGMTFAPRFSPEGNRIVFSRTDNGATNIYALDLRTRRPSRLTEGNSIDTTPSYSPDGSKIVFNSDRGGSQQLYVMDGSGGEARRISFGSGKYGTPVWSPRGDLIAFTKIDGGSFYIGVMRPDGSGERLLTQDFLVEGPTWAPNGRMLMYFRQGRSGGGRAASSRLYSIDLTGGNQREVGTPGDASDPAWSPLLR